MSSRTHSTTILIIEDEAEIRDTVADLLAEEGYATIAAEDGDRGVAVAIEREPELILCDVMMPGRDGYGVLAAVRQHEPTSLIPFVFLTAKGSKSDHRQGMELGADDYLVKPFSREELLQAVKARLEKHAALTERYVAEARKNQALAGKLSELDKYRATEAEVLESFFEELRSNISKISLAIRMLKSAPEDRRDRYLEVLSEECGREIELLDQISELRSFLTPDNVKMLKRYRLLK